VKTLIAPRALKGIDQVAMAADRYYGSSWAGPGWQRTITPDIGLSVMTAYQCVRILANAYASIPTILYRRLPGGGKERAADHPLYRTFAIQANPDMSAFDWKNLAKSHIETWGNHVSEIVRNGLGEVELWPIRPDRIEIYWGPGGRKAYDYLSPTGPKVTLDPDRVLHLKALTTDGLVGLPPITQMRRAIALYRKAEQYGESVFDNGARPAVVMKHPKTLSDPAVIRLGAQMDALRGSGNAGKTVILEEGLDVHEIGFPPEDAQFMETRLFQKRELAAGYGVPKGLLNDPDEDADIDKDLRQLITVTMLPAFESFEQSAQLQVIRDRDYFVEFLADAYLRGDPKARADAYAVQWEHGALSGDEWRARENQDPLPDGIGQTYYRPANWVPLGQQDESPPAVGGDASTDTQFGQGAALVDQVTRAKVAWVQFDCPDCGKIVNRNIPDIPGTVGQCKSCRAEKTYREAEVAA
jgi:HK97 family phage portal protein